MCMVRAICMYRGMQVMHVTLCPVMLFMLSERKTALPPCFFHMLLC